jgi:hypothetical protein
LEPEKEDKNAIFEELKLAVSKNKWCRSTLSRLPPPLPPSVLTLDRLSMFDHISKSLQRHGTCRKFIKFCNPDEFSPREERIKTLRLSVGWLENIANKLGTFWAFPERKFLMECLLHFDESGRHHIE